MASLHTGGVLKLVFAVTAKAVEDYNQLEKYGIVKNGELTGYWPSKRDPRGVLSRRSVVGIKTDAEALQLCYFLKSDLVAKASSHTVGSVSVDRIKKIIGAS